MVNGWYGFRIEARLLQKFEGMLLKLWNIVVSIMDIAEFLGYLFRICTWIWRRVGVESMLYSKSLTRLLSKDISVAAATLYFC